VISRDDSSVTVTVTLPGWVVRAVQVFGGAVLVVVVAYVGVFFILSIGALLGN